MELTRRDAVVALAALGVGAGGAGVAHRTGHLDHLGVDDAGTPEPDDSEAAPGPDADPLGHSLALAEVLYPSELTVTGEFVETYVIGRSRDDGTYREQLLTGLETLDERARRKHERAFTTLSVEDRDGVLRDFGLEDAAPNPDADGDLRGRIRYYLVDEFLYALYTSPTGGELVGNENPAGHPGGLQSYQRGPPE